MLSRDNPEALADVTDGGNFLVLSQDQVDHAGFAAAGA
jgi:hypothetical protein